MTTRKMAEDLRRLLDKEGIPSVLVPVSFRGFPREMRVPTKNGQHLIVVLAYADTYQVFNINRGSDSVVSKSSKDPWEAWEEIEILRNVT